jgi:glucokinase
VTRNTHKYIINIINILKQGGYITISFTKKLLDKLEKGGSIDTYLSQQRNKYDSIQEYLEKEIKGKFDEAKVFNELFTFKDIYVSLRAIELGTSLDDNAKILNLEDWTREYIEKRKKHRDQVLCIEGEPGSGKSTFCRKLSDDWILKHWHPLWTPIWIKSRDIKELGNNFEETIKKVLNRWDFAQNSDWLKDRNTCFVFLLDGLDELLTEQYPEQGWETFLQQAVNFQRDYGLNPEIPRHQILITTRSTVLQNTRRIPEQLKRIKIEPVDKESQKEWLKKWVDCNQGVPEFKETISKLKEFLSNKNWVTEPLLLYLLAAMWRDQKLDRSEFKEIDSLDSDGAKILIYEKLLDWLIDKQLPPWLQEELNSEQKKATFKRIVTEAGLCAIQSGGIRSSLAMLEERLTNQGNQFAISLMEEIKKNKGPEHPNAVLTIENDRSQLHFIHKSFSEFFYAKRLLESFKEWTKKWNNREQWENPEEFVIPTDRLDWEIYDLLGFGPLTQEIVEFLKILLKNEQKSERILTDHLQKLIDRLTNFYIRWFQGEFINNELGGTLARQKMLKLQKPLESQGLFLGRRQIDVYTGLNVLILLTVLHRQAQIPFYSCGKALNPCSGEEQFSSTYSSTSSDAGDKADEFEASRILRLMGYSRWLGAEVFINTVGPFLERVNLRRADLRGAELYGANLNEAYLSGVNLDGANLNGAKLNGAFLGNAKVCRADLRGAELNDAFLGNADLTNTLLGNAKLERAVLAGANLRNASLKGANLRGAYLGDADLSNANLSNADFTGADLSCANLSDANLTKAILHGANLTGAKLQATNLMGIRWDEKTDLKREIEELNKAFHIPSKLREEFNLSPCPSDSDEQSTEGVSNLLLAAHLGATKARFCLVKAENQEIIFHNRYPIGEFDDVLPLIKQFLAEAKGALRENYSNPKKYCLAVAGPITDNTSKMVNRALLPVNGDLLKEKLGNPVELINDFVAVAYGIHKLRKEKKDSNFITLYEGEPQEGGLIAVIGAATGLGKSFLVQQSNGEKAYPTEGGHIDFAPQSDLDFALFNYILENIQDKKDETLTRVGVERIVSGRGILAIYCFLRERERSEKGIKEQSKIERLVKTWQEEDKRCREFVDPAAAIASAALNKLDPLCIKTMQIFLNIFAAEVANFARQFFPHEGLYPYGGLYIAGGIAPQILRLIKEETNQEIFNQIFSTGELKKIPVYVLKNLEAGLIGAAHYAATKM